MPKKYFARFSRIIALFVLENTEKTDFKELPSGFNENKMISIHSFILGIPDLIETYAVILEYLREIMERLISTNPQNLRKSLRYLKESNLIKDSGLNLSFLKPLFEQSQFSESLVSEIFMPKFIVKFMVKKSNLVKQFWSLQMKSNLAMNRLKSCLLFQICFQVKEKWRFKTDFVKSTLWKKLWAHSLISYSILILIVKILKIHST